MKKISSKNKLRNLFKSIKSLYKPFNTFDLQSFRPFLDSLFLFNDGLFDEGLLSDELLFDADKFDCKC